MSYENFVQARLASVAAAGATSITLAAVEAPFRLPPTDGGVLVLADSMSKPVSVEIIRYASRSGLVLSGVQRSQEGTTAPAQWPAGTYCYQAMTAGQANSLVNIGNYGVGASGLIVGALTNLNDLNLPAGKYGYGGSAIGAPNGLPGTVEIFPYSTAAVRQVARPVSGVSDVTTVFERQLRVGPVYGNWDPVHTSTSQLALGTTQASAQAAIGVAGLPERVLALESKPWTGAADYDAITEGTWTVTSALAHAPAQFTGGPDAIVTVKRMDGDRLVQQVYSLLHNISVFRMRIMWQGSPQWAGWQEPATLDDWTPITSLLNGYTPLAGFPNRFRLLGKCLQLQLYANAAVATRTAGTAIWSVPFLYRPAHLCPIQARADLSSTAGQWSSAASLIIDGDVKLGPALAASVQKIAIDVFIPLGAP